MENSNLNNLPKFYAGQKVCYADKIGEGGRQDDGVVKESQVLTIKCKSDVYKGYQFWNVYEYDEFDFREDCLVPIEIQSFPLISLSKVIEKEKQLIVAN